MTAMTHSIQQVERHFVTRVDRRYIRSSPFPDAIMEMLEPRYLFSHPHVHAAPPPTPALALPSQLPIAAPSVSLFASASANTPAVGTDLTATSTITLTEAPIAQPANASPTDTDSLLATNNRDTLFGGMSERQETFVVSA